ncbi:MFS transporter [Paraburkholderia sediminicola]|uniref:MFS transporter n=1 Tax=Paraburkholderia sediminicola TaxID=458836 RepID=UPI0038B96B85
METNVQGRMTSLAVSHDDSDLLRKVGWRLVPLLMTCFVVAYFDRVNISFAKLQMQSQLGLSEASYGLGASMFFVGYLIFEVPSNVILVRVGARRWIARIMITWGIASAATMFVRTETEFYVLRFALGVLEAGFVPGVLYFFMQWFPAKQRGRIHSFFFGASALSGIIGGPLSGGIVKYMDGLHGLAGWQWLFLLEGIPSVMLGLLVLAMLDDRIEDATWLSAREKAALSAAIESEHKAADTRSFYAALREPVTYMLSLIYLSLCMGIYGIFFWMPQLVKTAGNADPFEIGLITTLPYIAAIIGTVLIGRSSDRTGERRWHLTGCVLAGLIGYAICATFGNSIVLLVLGLGIATTGLIASFALFWVFPPRVLGGVAAAGGIALINSIGQIGGVIAPFMVGKVKDLTGSASMGLYAIALVCALAATLIAWGLPRRIYFRDLDVASSSR